MSYNVVKDPFRHEGKTIYSEVAQNWRGDC